MIGRSIAELETPALCLEMDVLEERVRDVAALARRHNQSWRPEASWHRQPEVAAMQMQAGAVGISIARGAVARMFCQRGIASVHLSQPLADLKELWPMQEETHGVTWSATCDHFLHGELLSEWGQRMQRRIPVLIEVNVGHARIGARPGLDARDLARGISRLPGIEIRGASVSLGGLSPEESSAQQSVKSAEVILTELRDQMVRDGIGCEVLSAHAEGNVVALFESPILTEVRTGNLVEVRMPRQQSTFSGKDPLFVLSRVISRPKLERAVLDCGWVHLGESRCFPCVRQTVQHRPLPDVRIESLDEETMTVHLGPRSRDLIIGDVVEVIPGNAVLALRLQPQRFAVRSGVVEAVWQQLKAG